jgi:microcystin-dependent protein
MIATNFIVTSTFTLAFFTSDSISASSIQTGFIGASTISVSSITANSITNSTLVDMIITTSTLIASTTFCSNIYTNAININSTLTASSISAINCTTSSLLFSSMNGNTITGSNINYSTSIGSTLTSNTLYYSTSICSTISTTSLSISGSITYYNNPFIPIGIIVIFYNSSIPAGWALCNGQTVARSDGGGNITTPNLVGSFIFGGSTVNTTQQGISTIALSIDNLPSHSHAINDSGHSHQQTFISNPAGIYGFGGNNTNWNGPYDSGTYTKSATTGITLNSTGTNTPASFNTMPPYVILCYIMKY